MQVHPKTKQAYQLLHDGTLALARAEQQGIRVDMDYIENNKEKLKDRISRLEFKFKNTKFYKHWSHQVGGRVNVHSNAQLAHFLYDVKKIKPVKITESGKGGTDEESLLQLNIPELKTLITIRQLKKIKDTYLESFAREQVRGFIHPSFNLHLVRTFRSSSDKPNFQNIPKRDEEAMMLTRSALYPREGYQLLEIDYSGLEVRIAACYHEDSRMLEYISSGHDMHQDLCKDIFLMKKYDKTDSQHRLLRAGTKNGFVFPQFYGDYYGNNALSLACTWGELPQGQWKPGQGIELGSGTLSDHLIDNGISSLGQFTKHIQLIEKDFWNKKFPEYRDWKERWWAGYKKHGFIDMKTGFRCSGVMSRNDVTNYPVQGAAFHCLLWSFAKLDWYMQKENWKTRLIGQIHDSIILDVHPDELRHVSETIKRVTTTELAAAWDWIIVPLNVDAEICEVDGPWSIKKDYEL